MTEWAQRLPKADLASGMEYGRSILNALRLGSSAWMAFEWIHPAANQSGLISSQWGKDVPETRYWRSKAYSVFKQIANTSPAGGRCVPIGADNEMPTEGLEYLAIRKDNKLVIHLVNDLPISQPYKVTGNGLAKPTTAWLTDFHHDFAEQDAASSQGHIPPYALLTLEYRVPVSDRS